jgi:hypothetical protein
MSPSTYGQNSKRIQKTFRGKKWAPFFNLKKSFILPQKKIEKNFIRFLKPFFVHHLFDRPLKHFQRAYEYKDFHSRD